MRSLTFGADIEYLLRTKDTGSPWPACGLFGGTKTEPKQFPGMPEGFMYQEDGAALEVNIPICNSIPEFVQAVRRVRTAAAMLADNIGLMICDEDTLEYGDMLDPAIVPQAFEIGCLPDSDAYSAQDKRDRFDIAEFGRERFAGAHIHIGFEKSLIGVRDFVRQMDVCFYVNELISKGNRRKFYGQPGIYRDKPYGVEYRSLGPQWTSGLTGVSRLTRGLRELEAYYTSIATEVAADEAQAVS